MEHDLTLLLEQHVKIRFIEKPLGGIFVTQKPRKREACFKQRISLAGFLISSFNY